MDFQSHLDKLEAICKTIDDIINSLDTEAKRNDVEFIRTTTKKVIEKNGFNKYILEEFVKICIKMILINRGFDSAAADFLADNQIFALKDTKYHYLRNEELIQDYTNIYNEKILEKFKNNYKRYFNTLFKSLLSVNYLEVLDIQNILWECYDLINRYTQYLCQENKKEFDTEQFPNCIKFIAIRNFQCIKSIAFKLPVDAQFIVFTGENGDGKTSILQAIALGIIPRTDLHTKQGEDKTLIEVQYNLNKETFHHEIYFHPFVGIAGDMPYTENKVLNFAAYGASRLQLESIESSENQKLLRSPIYNLFYSNGILQNIETWLKTRLLKGETEKYNNVVKLLIKLLPNVTAIERKDTVDNVIFVYTEKGVKVPMEHLSSGHKSIVAMIGDMIIRLSSAQPEITNPKDFAGIVLIDELETHLHPKWQKEFPKILAETFSKVQFIVTTHSAITLLGMPKNTVFFKVTRTEEEGTQIERLEIDVENLTPNLLLSSPIFGLQDIFSVQNKGMENVHTGNFFDEKDTRQQAKDKIRALYRQLKDKENNEKSN